MADRKLPRYFVFISICTFVAILFSVIQQSYNNLIKASVDLQNNALIKSVSPNLDVEVLDEIEKRQEILP